MDNEKSTHSKPFLNYCLITPVRNEEEYIELTIKSVISQTILPLRWVIVSDGSTDLTDEIVQGYLSKISWMELIQLSARKERHFAGKAIAFNVGYEKVRNLNYDIIGNLDSDISFEPDYFEYLLTKFKNNYKLGVAGTHYIEGNFHSYKDSYINVHHVNGQCQLFRRKCFEEIGGYMPIKGGGIDWVAATTARMNGWETYSFGDRTFTHHRAMGTAGSNILKSRFNYGKKDYMLGGHPLWQIFRSVFQMTNKPYIIGGLCLLYGYFGVWLIRLKRPLSDDLIKFHRQEQIKRMIELFERKMKVNRQ